jgi:hypothetical protein
VPHTPQKDSSANAQMMGGSGDYHNKNRKTNVLASLQPESTYLSYSSPVQ